MYETLDKNGDNMETRRKKFIRHKNYLAKGIGESGHVRSLVYIVVGAGGMTGALDFWQMISIGIIYIITSYVFGFAWDKYKLYDEEAEFGNERNPFVKEMRAMEKRLKNYMRTL